MRKVTVRGCHSLLSVEAKCPGDEREPQHLERLRAFILVLILRLDLMFSRLTSNSESSCLSFPNSRIIGKQHQTWPCVLLLLLCVLEILTRGSPILMYHQRSWLCFSFEPFFRVNNYLLLHLASVTSDLSSTCS